MPRSHGYRRKTRSLLRRDEGPRGLSFLLSEFKAGQPVIIDIDPRQHKGMPHRRYQGRVGRVAKVFRRALMVEIALGSKVKKVYARFEHVRTQRV